MLVATPPWNSCVSLVTVEPDQPADALIPNRLLLLLPAESCGMFRPQLVSSAACAIRWRGSTPSSCPACCACGHRSWTKLVFAASETVEEVVVARSVAEYAAAAL